MPIASRYPEHPVRVLRTTLGLGSAEKFGRFTGIPAETIRNLEQGRRPVTKHVAVQIGIATGVLYSWLMTGNWANGSPIDPMLKPLTKEAFEAFAGISPRREETFDLAIKTKLSQIESLLRAAVRRHRLPACSYFLSIAFRQALEQFDLERETQEEMIKLSPENPVLPFIKIRGPRPRAASAEFKFTAAPVKLTVSRLKRKPPSRRQPRGKSANSARRPSASRARGSAKK